MSPAYTEMLQTKLDAVHWRGRTSSAHSSRDVTWPRVESSRDELRWREPASDRVMFTL